ncbi:MAG: DUF934 domain-containing protein [Motiliproteus sp.]|nr:DUF934 domain-containing protein [Motiliproteus sp.]MCW9051205.1 DUF934 domain-containing protein [Motiliproteus sp.]
MSTIVRDGGIVDDEWQLLEECSEVTVESLESDKLILPFAEWLARFNQQGASPDQGVWLDDPDQLQSLSSEIKRLPVVAVRFHEFTDGRGFSVGAILRETYGFSGELRAFGNLLVDQLPLLRRCGFNAFVLADEDQRQQAVELLAQSPLSYQGSVYSPRTPFRFRFPAGGASHAKC